MEQVAQETVGTWSERHPKWVIAWEWLVSLFHYIFDGHIIVDLGRWVVLYCGRVSETAMLLATLWVTATFVTPELTSMLGGTAVTLSSLSMMAFSLLPEVILFSAIIKTLKHWDAVLHERKSIKSWAWALLYTLPTLTFFGMTVYTITSFVSTSGHLQTASGNALVLRCLAGWFYSLVGLIHAGMTARKNESEESVITPSLVDVLRGQLDAQHQEMEQLREQYTLDLQQTITRLETQNNERLQTTIEMVMERVTQTVIERVSVSQTDALPVVTGEDNPLEYRQIEAPLETSLPSVKEYPRNEDNNDFQEEITDSKMDFTASSFPVLRTYPRTFSWLSTGQKTATVNEVISVTGHSRKMIANRIKDGTLKTSGRNPDLVRISTVIQWLEVAPIPEQNNALNGNRNSDKQDVKEAVIVG